MVKSDTGNRKLPLASWQPPIPTHTPTPSLTTVPFVCKIATSGFVSLFPQVSPLFTSPLLRGAGFGWLSNLIKLNSLPGTVFNTCLVSYFPCFCCLLPRLPYWSCLTSWSVLTAFVYWFTLFFLQTGTPSLFPITECPNPRWPAQCWGQGGVSEIVLQLRSKVYVNNSDLGTSAPE